MPPIAMENLSAKFNNGEITLTWSFPSQAPDSVFVVPVLGAGAARRIITQETMQYALSNVVNGVRFRHNNRSPHDVSRCEYIVYLDPAGSPMPDFSRMMHNPAFFVTMTAGKAMVYFSVKTKKAEKGFERHTISLQSQFSIEQGIMGYTFTLGHRPFSAVLPGAIISGKHKYPPFFTQEGSNINVGVIGGANPDVVAIRM